MSELDKTIEELEAEVLAELEEAAHQPDDSGGPADAPKKVKSDGVTKEEDGGKAVVDPKEKSSPRMLQQKVQKKLVEMHNRRVKEPQKKWLNSKR